MRRGYRYLGRRHIANGTAETVYKEFKECIEWANGKRPFETKIATRYYFSCNTDIFCWTICKVSVIMDITEYINKVADRHKTLS